MGKRAYNFKDLTGKRFGRLVAIDYEIKSSRAYWLCICNCGNIKIIAGDSLSGKKTKSCGCLRKEQITKRNFLHGMEGTSFYIKYGNAYSRCKNKNNEMFKYYGGRNIKFLWNSFQEFMDDMYELYLEHVKIHGEKNTTLERKDVNGHYCKENCLFATFKQQANNMNSNHLITYKNKTQNIKQWSEELKISYSALLHRINNYGWSVKRAFETSVRKTTKK